MFMDIMEKYRKQFPYGSFAFSLEQNIREVVRTAEVPEKYGVYIIFDPHGQVLYIGRSGTMNNDGTFRQQTLRRRLVNKQGGRPRQTFFENLLQELQITSLHFEWFVTFDGSDPILPSFAESELLQEYFRYYNKLPPLNKEA